MRSRQPDAKDLGLHVGTVQNLYVTIDHSSEVSDVLLERGWVDQMCIGLVEKLTFRVYQSLGPGECFVHLDSQVTSMVLWFA